jgi:maltose/moltooligosaccharide transporter
MSDKTWNKLGRRRPYFLSGAILASLALCIMPNSPILWVAAGMLWIMDASINVSMEPFRAFVGDMLPSQQRTTGFAMQSFFIGTGAIIASALPFILTKWFGINNTAPEGQVPESVKLSFYCGAAVFLLAVIWTVFSSKEYSPEEMLKFNSSEKQSAGNGLYASNILVSSDKMIRNGIIWFLSGGFLLALFWIFIYIDFGLIVFFAGGILYGLLQILSGILTQKKKHENGLVIIINDLYKMPKTMRQLAPVQFFTWFALFAMWIYTTPGVTKHIYHTTDTTSALFNEGANWVGVLFAAYSGFAAIVAFLLPVIAKKTSRKTVHMLSLIIGGVSLISFYFISNPEMLIISMIGIGLAWASILSMPYAILAGALPSEKMGVYMGIFNFFIVIPQITAAAILGFIVRSVFHGEAIYALLLGGVSMIIAGILVIKVLDVDLK